MPDKKKICIICDTREPSGLYMFKRFKDVFIIRDNLTCGDFSVFPYGDSEFFIERKTIADLSSSFTSGRERFEAEWKRANPDAQKTLLVEGGGFVDILTGNYRSNFNPASFLGSLFSWSMKYKFNIIFVANSAEGQIAVYWLCREFLRQKKLQEAKNDSIISSKE